MANPVIQCLCKRNFVPVVSDNDDFDINNIIAMELALRAYNFLKANDRKTYMENMIESVGYLNGEMARSMPESEDTQIQFDHYTRAGQICNIP